MKKKIKKKRFKGLKKAINYIFSNHYNFVKKMVIYTYLCYIWKKKQ